MFLKQVFLSSKSILLSLAICIAPAITAMQASKQQAQAAPTQERAAEVKTSSAQTHENNLGLGGQAGDTKTLHGQEQEQVDEQQVIDIELLNRALISSPSQIAEMINSFNNPETEFSDFPKAYFLFGSAGTGKKTLAQAIATACKLPHILLDATLIASDYIKTDGKNLDTLFAEIAQLEQRCFVIIDGIEAFAQQPIILAKIHAILGQEESQILFIGIFKDASIVPIIKKQFDTDPIEIPLPHEAQREELISYFIKSNKAFTFNDVSAKLFAQKTENFSPQDLKTFIILSMIIAQKRHPDTPVVGPLYCLEALSIMKKSNDFLNDETLRKQFTKGAKKHGPKVAAGAGILAGMWALFKTRAHWVPFARGMLEGRIKWELRYLAEKLIRNGKLTKKDFGLPDDSNDNK